MLLVPITYLVFWIYKYVCDLKCLIISILFQIMAIGDGENDIEMLKLVNLGVALSNGSEKTKAIADMIGLSNDEDGVADAIYRYAF